MLDHLNFKTNEIAFNHHIISATTGSIFNDLLSWSAKRLNSVSRIIGSDIDHKSLHNQQVIAFDPNMEKIPLHDVSFCSRRMIMMKTST